MPNVPATEIAAVRRHNPAALARIDDLAALASGAIDERLHGLIRSRVAAILDPRIDEAAAGPLTKRDVAALAFVDQYVISVAGMTDDLVKGLLPHFSSEEIFALVHAVYTLDGIERTRLVLCGRDAGAVDG